VKRLRVGIRGKIAAVILICMLPVLILGVLLFQYRNQGRREVVQRGHLEAARATASAVQGFIAGAVASERTVGAAVTSQPYPVSGILQLFAAIQASDPSFLSLVLIDGSGHTVAAIPDPSAAGVSGDASVDAVQSGRAWSAGPPVWIGGQPTLTVATAIRDGGRLAAIVAARLDLARLRDVLPPARSVDSIVLDARGRLVIDLGRPGRGAEAFQGTGAVRRAVAGQEARIDGYRDPGTGTRYLGAAVPVREIGWVAVALEPESSALESARRAAAQEFIILVAAVGLGLFLAWVLGGELSAPIFALARGARALGRGELGTRVILHRTDELGELGGAFNEMSRRLAGYVGEMNALQAVSDVALSTVRLDALLPPLVDRVVAALHADEGMIWFVDEPSGALVQPAGWTEDASGAGRHRARGKGVADRVAREGRPMVLSDPAHLSQLDPELAAGGAVATMGVPLRAGGRVIGAVLVWSRRPREFTAHETRLLETFADRVALAVDNAKAFEREHELAEIIQQTLLPPRAVRLPGLAVAGRYLASRDVGGDFYAVLPLGEDRVGLAIADVAGKGIPAATLSARARYLLEAFALEDARPDGVLGRLNHVLARDADPNFVSLFYGILSPRERCLRFANAGHLPPLLLRAGARAPVSLETPGLLLGVRPETAYVPAEVPVGPGDVLVMFTDGITEARSSNGEEFGDERLAALLDGPAAQDPGALADRVVDGVAAYSPGIPADDRTVVVVRIDPQG